MIPDALRAALGDRYLLEHELGRGGMAVVYAARDDRHSRRVAVKVLSQVESASRNAERFQQEVRIAAGLVHPHILPVFDSGEAAGHLYYVMPLVEGESLRAKLLREGRLATDEAIRLTREVAEALDCAHRAGVTHRDVKPENILLAHGHAVLADFGIARHSGAAAAPGLTLAGTFIGTPEYMSPEALLGEATLGPWSDLYALGCVTFEMLTGEPPHAGRGVQAIIASRLTQPAPKLRERRPDLSASLETAIGQALAPEPSQRHASAAAFAASLVGHDHASTQAADYSLVVRPFESVGDDDELAFFSDGITEEAIGDLSKLRALRVISRSSAMRLKGSDKDVRTIGREYGVRYVVTGSVRRSGSRVRVATEIADALLDSPVWAGKFDGTWDDPFGLQEQVARGIVDALHLRMSEQEEQRLRTRPIPDLRAYECYRRVMAELLSFSPAGLARAESLLDEALAITGDNALLLSAKGALHWQYINAGFDTAPSRLALAQQALERALVLDPTLTDAHAILAWIDSGTERIAEGLLRIARALSAAPSHNSLALTLGSIMSWVLGQHDLARRWVRQLRSVDPFDLWGVVVDAAVHAGDGDRVGRDRLLALAAELSDGAVVRFFSGVICAQDADLAPAFAHWQRAVDLGEPGPFAALCQGILRARDGEPQHLRNLGTNPDYAGLFEHDAQYAWHLAEALAVSGEREAALTTLATAVRIGFSNVPMLEGRDATLHSLHGDPRYEALLQDARRQASALDIALRGLAAPMT